MPELLVLRNLAGGNVVRENRRSVRGARRESPFEDFGPSTTAASESPEPRVELHDVSSHEAATMARDPEVAAVAIPMPTTLIRPSDVGAGATANDAWGIAAVKADVTTCSGDGVVEQARRPQHLAIGWCGHEERSPAHARQALDLRGDTHQLHGVPVRVAEDSRADGLHGAPKLCLSSRVVKPLVAPCVGSR